MQIDVAFEMNRPLDEPVARGHDDASAAGLVASGDRRVERRPAVGLAVAHGAVLDDGKIAVGKRRRLDRRDDRRHRVPAGGVGGGNLRQPIGERHHRNGKRKPAD